jgi:hypothetical protein
MSPTSYQAAPPRVNIGSEVTVHETEITVNLSKKYDEGASLRKKKLLSI